MLETGAVATAREIAANEKINSSYVSRVLRLTLLAPEIVDAILDGRQPVQVTVPVLMGVFGGVAETDTGARRLRALDRTESGAHRIKVDHDKVGADGQEATHATDAKQRRCLRYPEALQLPGVVPRGTQGHMALPHRRSRPHQVNRISRLGARQSLGRLA